MPLHKRLALQLTKAGLLASALAAALFYAQPQDHQLNLIAQAHATNPNLTPSQVAFFKKPLSLEQTPTTDIEGDDKGVNFEEFRSWLVLQAYQQGFDGRVLGELEKLKFIPKVVRSDRSQYERILANRRAAAEKKPDAEPQEPKVQNLMQRYLNLHISDEKVMRGALMIQNYEYSLRKISQQYKVPMEAIVGLWGMESNFGVNQGSYDLLDALASLAYEGRRRQFFTREFFNALRVMELNGFTKTDMKSSWAGAMGQIQFMPSSYLLYGADGNADGITNIWLSVLDSFASIANYLSSEGWRQDLPWGIPVSMTFEQYLASKDLIGYNKKEKRSIAEWEKLGFPVTSLPDGYKINRNAKEWWLHVPDNEPAMAYLVSENYKVYNHWNRSQYFAYANGMFAAQLKAKVAQLNKSGNRPATSN